MAKFKLHKLAALIVLAGFAGWVATGEFSSVGSAQNESEATPAAAEQPKTPLRTVAVVTPPHVMHARAIRISGRTEADKRAVLAAREAGIIAELPVRQGDMVKAGDLILMLDAEEKPAEVETAQALLKQREAEWEAVQRLAKTGSTPKLQVDNAFSALAAAKSQLQAIEAELARNRVVAPFDGVVDRVMAELGSSVMQGGEVATILALDPIIAKGEISERELAHLKIGDEAEARLVNGDVVKGSVRYFSREASSQTRTFPIEIAIANADGAIPSGMTAEITILAARTDAVVLPRSVVTLSGKGDLGIRAVDKQDKVVFFPIDLIDDTSGGLVLAGIPADARIIVAGQEMVTEGDTVRAVEADAAALGKATGQAADGT